jgi:alanine-alpha-ketoisovalerate/valine-pyruvate aminotransferase
MAGLDNVPQTQSIEIAIAKIEEDVLKSMNELNSKINLLISDFGQIYIRKKELSEELIRLDDIVERAEDEFKSANNQMKEIVDSLDETYPQGRINLKEGTIQYQPGAPTRKQQEEQQAQERQQAQSPDFKVVKE